jgi:type IV pilus assembly protein PilP
MVLGPALMLMLIWPVWVSAAPKLFKAGRSAVGHAVAGSAGASAGASAARAVAAPAKPAAQAAAAPAKPEAAQTQSQSQPQPSKDFFRYNPKGQADPFKPFIDPDAEKRKAGALRALPANPLQQIAVGQFRLVGVIESDRGRRAMVQDPAGRFYSLDKGSRMGLNEGRVTAILKDSVVVTEKITTDEGKIQMRKQIIQLLQQEVKP